MNDKSYKNITKVRSRHGKSIYSLMIRHKYFLNLGKNRTRNSKLRNLYSTNDNILTGVFFVSSMLFEVCLIGFEVLRFP
jgi:hypothetical protein